MQTEIEVKFLDLDLDDVRKRLERIGATREQPMRFMRRSLVEEPHHKVKRAFVRIRDQGDKITMTYKQRDDELALHGTKEIEVEVGDFQTTVDLLEAAGWAPSTYQESRRETWTYGEAEIVLDEWPWIKPYIEIEAPSEKIVKETAETLGYAWKDAVIGSVDIIYQRDYPNMTVRGVIDIKNVRFDDPAPPEFTGEK